MCKKSIFSLCLIGITIISCNKNENNGLIVAYDNTPYNLDLSNSTLPTPNFPADNPITNQKVILGKRLFFEKDLSLDGSINCASCHVQKDAFSDINQFSAGVNGTLGGRQAMAIFNLAWNENGFFWDGRAELLRHQSIQPIENPIEMAESLDNVIAKLSANPNYRDQFYRAFGSEEITATKMSLALESYMFTLISDDSKYDRYLKGTETLTDSEERGRQLFFAEYNPFFPEVSGADCAHCHSGNNFENDQYMNNGLDSDAEFTDMGREDITENPSNRAQFKVTSLRNIALTAPYMHDGRFATLEEVIDHYNEGIKTSSTLDPALNATTGTGLMLDAGDKADLVNFLMTLTDYTFINNKEYQKNPLHF